MSNAGPACGRRYSKRSVVCGYFCLLQQAYFGIIGTYILKGEKPMKKVLPTLVILILIGVLGTIFYKTYYVKYSYSAEKADVNAYYGVQSEDDYPVVLQDQLSDYHARKMGDHFYLDLAAVRELINDRFYYSEEDGELSYCLPETRVYAQEGSSTWKDTSGNETTEDYEICVQFLLRDLLRSQPSQIVYGMGRAPGSDCYKRYQSAGIGRSEERDRIGSALRYQSGHP